MKERLIQLLDLEQLSPSKFADIIGVQRSSISHVISGRNKPGFDFLQKTLKAFPGLNASWLMLGEGTMYEQMGRTVSGNLFDSPVAPVDPAEEQDSGTAPDYKETEPSGTATEREVSEQALSPGLLEEVASTSRKRIVQLIVIYEDDTFKAFTPAH